MAEQGFFHISLAGKCRLLFGLAVVLIVAAALFVPWWTMEQFVQDRNIQRARSMALLAHARVDPANPDWNQQQDLLNQWWKDNSKPLKLPEAQPTLILLSPAALAAASNRALLQRIQKQIRNLNKASRFVPPTPELGIGSITWSALPDALRSKALTGAQAIVSRMSRAIEPPYPVLDQFQQDAIRDMRANESVNAVPGTERKRGQPTTYRYILAVRGEEAGSSRRPLAGIIDVKLPIPTDEALLGTRLMIVLAGVLAGFLAILVFYLITQKLILKPVRELRSLAEQVAHGDLSARANIQTGDEYQDLGTAFNDMLEELDRSRVELETINRSLDTRLGELAETNVALYESNRLKSEFLANVSHELRTPLTSIIGFADLMRDGTSGNGPIDGARAARYANNILTSGRMLLEIINDLLDLAKIEAGRIEVHRTVFSPRDVCEALVDFMRPLIDKKMQTLELELHEPLPMMNSDAGKMRQVLYNLLSNAVKYTPEGGRITFIAETADGDERVRMTVSDNGPGIAPEQQERVFEKFRQLDASVTREHSGTGLGLAISRELTHMLGGSLRLESELGRGATFIVELPVECPALAHRAMPSLT
jgi:two-component system, NarL family, sensor histidine kinase BarA